MLSKYRICAINSVAYNLALCTKPSPPIKNVQWSIKPSITGLQEKENFYEKGFEGWGKPTKGQKDLNIGE